MFTGIVQALAPIVALQERVGLRTISLALPPSLARSLELGASVSVDGVCLTVISLSDDVAAFDVMHETLRRTTLGGLRRGSRVNIERSVKLGDEIGGHIVSGHVAGVGEIRDVLRTANNVVFTLVPPEGCSKYLFDQGFVALDGVSLTVVEVLRERGVFRVSLIPETLRRTTFGFKKAGDAVNVEIDAATRSIVDTAERVLASRAPPMAPVRRSSTKASPEKPPKKPR